MSSLLRIYAKVVVLIIFANNYLIRCQLAVKYTHEINDCFHLCFGIDSCIDICEEGFRSRGSKPFSPHVDNFASAGVIKRQKLNTTRVASENKSKVTSFDSLQEIQPNCGLRFVDNKGQEGEGMSGFGRIVGGEDAEDHEFPWLVSLQLIREGKSPKHFCGAAIINENYIITAAHCTDSLRDKESQVLIKAGVNSWAENAQIIKPEKFIVHEGWNAEKQLNDVSLIRVQTPIKFTVNNNGQYTVNSICLPPDDTDPSGFAQLAGWGQLAEDKDNAEWLQKITMPIWKRKKCQINYKEYMAIQYTHICAGGRGGEDSCMGDSGGPLIQTEGSRSFIIGVVSFGIPCAVKGLPGVYTHLVHYMDWITTNMF